MDYEIDQCWSLGDDYLLVSLEPAFYDIFLRDYNRWHNSYAKEGEVRQDVLRGKDPNPTFSVHRMRERHYDRR